MQQSVGSPKISSQSLSKLQQYRKSSNSIRQNQDGRAAFNAIIDRALVAARKNQQNVAKLQNSSSNSAIKNKKQSISRAFSPNVGSKSGKMLKQSRSFSPIQNLSSVSNNEPNQKKQSLKILTAVTAISNDTSNASISEIKIPSQKQSSSNSINNIFENKQMKLQFKRKVNLEKQPLITMNISKEQISKQIFTDKIQQTNESRLSTQSQKSDTAADGSRLKARKFQNVNIEPLRMKSNSLKERKNDYNFEASKIVQSMMKNMCIKSNDVTVNEMSFAEFDDNNFEIDERVATENSNSNRNFAMSYNSAGRGVGSGGGVQSLNISAVKISKIDLTRSQKRKQSDQSVTQSSSANFHSNPAAKTTTTATTTINKKQSRSPKLSNAYNSHVHPFLKSMNFQVAETPYFSASTKNKQALPLQTPKNCKLNEPSSMKKISFKQKKRSPLGRDKPRQGFGPILKYKKITKGLSHQMLTGKPSLAKESNKQIRTPKASSSSQRTMSKSWLNKGLKNKVSFSEEQKSPKSSYQGKYLSNLSKQQLKEKFQNDFRLMTQNFEKAKQSNKIGGFFGKIQTSPRIYPKHKHDILPSSPCDENQKSTAVENIDAQSKIDKMRGKIVRRILNQGKRQRFSQQRILFFYKWKGLSLRQHDKRLRSNVLFQFYNTIKHNISKKCYLALIKWKNCSIEAKYQKFNQRSKCILMASNKIQNLYLQRSKKLQTFKKWREIILMTRNSSILTKKLESIQDMTKAFEEDVIFNE